MLTLSHNGSEWHGTFSVTAAALLNDLLADGQPVEGTLTIDGGARKHNVTGAILEVTKRNEITIDTEGGDTQYIPVDHVLAINIP